VLHGEPRSRPHLPFETFRYRHLQSGRDENNAAWLNHEILGDRRVEIHAGGAGGLIRRQRQAVGPWEPVNLERQHRQRVYRKFEV